MANEIQLRDWCVVSASWDGDDRLLVVEKTGVAKTLFCDGATMMGRVAAVMVPGDCANFSTEFVPFDTDLGQLGWLPLMAVELVHHEPADSGGDGGDGDDGDGDGTGGDDGGGDDGGGGDPPPPPDNNGRG